MISAQGLVKGFGDRSAVAGVSFTARDGRVTGLLGPNGAGKTTTLRMLYGAYRPDRGQARVDDRAPDTVGGRARLGVLPDKAGLYRRLTVREHLLYSARLYGLGRGEAERALASHGLAELAERACGALSHGEQRKVSLARALVHEPQNVVLDEPTSGLDVPATRQVRALIRSLARAGRCVLFSSHVMQEVASTCDRVVILAHGQVVAEGAPAELMATTGADDLEEAFVTLIGSEEGLG